MLRTGALVACATVVLAACGGGSGGGGDTQRQTGSAFAACYSNPSTCNSAEPGELKQGGQLIYAIEKNIANWNLRSNVGTVFETSQVL